MNEIIADIKKTVEKLQEFRDAMWCKNYSIRQCAMVSSIIDYQKSVVRKLEEVKQDAK